MNRISFQDTHVYPGCMAILFFAIAPNHTTVSALAEFSDGAVADAEVEPVNSEELVVRIDCYTTASGTHIPKKTWRIRYDNTQDIWKAVAKM
ncbi:hypothetical protein GCM10011386_07210 [Parapedobacter defluvii]|uniref:Uncharacterized protein n=1 Tax=Parapedobacter defluvii TaxID=2045106 RepID=A0ABQ1L7N3_9SPHI|nr:hypothetical protein [Parapedobacter defluvii]GGC17825.1 hypothetical protein GCM10011386_07210 [Parapedobacter defluvii]